MGFMSRVETSALRATTPGPTDDYWYYSAQRLAGTTVGGVPVTVELANQVSAVFACVDVLAVTMASLSLDLTRRLPNGGKERADDHPLYDVLSYRPNGWQTRFEFIEYLVRQLFLRGNFYAEKDFTDDALYPVHPNLVKVEQLTNRRLRYRWTPPGESEIVRTQDEMVHVRDTSEDSITGMSRVYLARRAIAVASQSELFSERFLQNDGSGRVIMKHPAKLNDETRSDIHRVYKKFNAGADNKGSLLIAENGAELNILPGLNESGFLTEPRKFQLAEICRYFGRVPPFMIGHEDKTTWGTNIEQIKLGFVAFCARPLGNRIREALMRDLLTREERREYSIDFDYADLLEGDLLTTVQALAIERQNGLVSPNEARAVLKRNPRDDAGGDEYQDTPTGAAPNAGEPTARKAVQSPPDASAVPAPMVLDAARRIAAKEVTAVGRHADHNGLPFVAWCRGYYTDHRRTVADVLKPIVESYGVSAFVATQAADRLESTAVTALGMDGVPAGWLDQRPSEVALILTEVFQAEAAMRRAA
jgi:HK97 family phage portal protein